MAKPISMKLCVLFTIWGDSELFQSCLKHTVDNLMGRNGDNVIVVYSTISNFGEYSEAPHWFHGAGGMNFEPDLNLPPAVNERNKRNFALQKAKELGFTHFLMADEDEFYDPYEFLKEKERFKNPDLLGLVCRVKCYFKEPTLTIGYDVTLVPFIHKITPGLCFTWNQKYPFAFEGPKREIRIDPTRQMNITSGVEWSEITMHHYSWIRPDYEKKIRNSTARENIERSTILTDLRDAKAGSFCKFYGKTLEPCSDVFNLWDSLPFMIGLKPK